MENGIGSNLRAARIRREIELAEVEESTKIRVRYLRAMEDEEWDVLPGGPYTPSFIRRYATYLGLDGQRLADDYKRSLESPAADDSGLGGQLVAGGDRRGSQRLQRGVWVAAGAIVVIAAAILVASLGRGGGETKSSPAPTTPAPPRSAVPSPDMGGKRSGGTVAVRLTATAAVWVCLLDADGRPLVDGLVLKRGTREGPFHSGSFTVSFGNGEVSMQIDGKEASIPATPNPLGYAIDSNGRLSPLLESQRPTCT